MERKSETVSIATSGKHTLLNLVFNIFLSFKNLIWLTWWDFQKPQWIKKFNEKWRTKQYFLYIYIYIIILTSAMFSRIVDAHWVNFVTDKSK